MFLVEKTFYLRVALLQVYGDFNCLVISLFMTIIIVPSNGKLIYLNLLVMVSSQWIGLILILAIQT